MTDATSPATMSLGDILTLALNTAKSVEAVFPPGSGKQKLDAVMAVVGEFAPLVALGASIVETVVPVLVNAAVAEWNKLGVFVHSVEAQMSASAAAPATQPAP